MGKLLKPNNTEKNHKKRLKKNKRKQIKYEKKKARMELTRMEVQRALETLPAEGTSREPENDSSTPRNYLHHQVRRNAQKVVDEYYNRVPVKNIKEEATDDENDGKITPQASYDFYD